MSTKKTQYRKSHFRKSRFVWNCGSNARKTGSFEHPKVSFALLRFLG
jgi:hypothetical protein